MRTNFTILILLIAFNKISGQSSSLTHLGGNGDWLGWDSSTLFPLSIEHRANQHINFSTNNAFRMRLTNNGRLGVGINTTATLNSTLTLNDFGPGTNGLLFRTEGNQLYQNMWQMYTGTTQTSQSEKFRIYSETGASPFIGFRTTSNNGGFRFETSGLNPNGSVTPFERIRVNGMQNMVVNGISYNADGFVGI
jgi:hypothetical protein